jgi:hypothetical protein
MSEGEGGAAARTGETDGMKKEAVPKTVSKRNKTFFMVFLRRVSDILLNDLDAEYAHVILPREETLWEEQKTRVS